MTTLRRCSLSMNLRVHQNTATNAEHSSLTDYLTFFQRIRLLLYTFPSKLRFEIYTLFHEIIVFTLGTVVKRIKLYNELIANVI